MSIRSAARKAPEAPATQPEATEDARVAMDNMYRFTRHVYDATRKYYLLGRDHLIDNLNAKPGEIVCEAGCGTARNLFKMAKHYPKAKFCGFDASDEMLKTARKSMEGQSFPNLIGLKQGYAQSYDPIQMFGLSSAPDKIVFSYALSIIPPWKESVDHTLALLKSGGEMHIVDFGGQEELPSAFRSFLFWWLDKFHVYFKPEIPAYLRQLENEGKGTLTLKSLYKGYAWYAVFKKA